MAEQTAIGWTDSTFNPWIGCTKVSPACDNCYAAVSTPVRSMKIEWGPRKPRHRTSASNWRQPRAWNLGHSKFYAEHGRRRRVFCASLADVFDKDAPPEWRAELFSLVRDTPHLDWLLLTKRIGNVECMTVDALGGSARDALHSMPRNVWLGITVANQEEAGRDIPKLLALPARVRFLSIEPMLGPIDLSHWLVGCDHGSRPGPGGVGGVTCMECGGDGNGCQRLGWVICGGESGRNARPIQAEWVKSLRDQCAAARVPFFFKQWGGATATAGGCELGGAEVKEWPCSA